MIKVLILIKKKKEWITKVLAVLLTCVVIKIIIIEIIKILVVSWW